MKVILLQEVKGKGVEGDVVDVARGYAVNYLLPNKMAVQATSGNLKQLEARKGNIEKRESARVADAEGLAGKLEGKTVVIKARAGEGGKLFGSVTSQMIEEAILEQLDVEVDRRKLDVRGHIKDLGKHEITVGLHKGVDAHLMVHVVDMEAPAGEPEGLEGLQAEAAAASSPELYAEVPSAEEAAEVVEERAQAEEQAEEQPEEQPEKQPGE